MKKSQRILIKIIIFVLFILCLYVIRGDIMILINRIYPNFDNEKVGSFIIDFNGKKEKIMPAKIDIPGALRVVNNITDFRKNDIVLTKTKILELTNQERKLNGGINLLKENKLLDISAEKKLKDMFAKQYFEHVSPSGKGVGDLGDESGYKYILIGENLAMGNFEDDSDLVNAWMESKGHRANILNPNYTEIGVAVMKGQFEGKDIWMAVQHFGTPRDICPNIDQELYNSIVFEQSQIVETESDLLKIQDRLNNGVFDEGSSHREQISNFNLSVKNYNSLIEKVKEEIKIYNEQVSLFNLCISKYE